MRNIFSFLRQYTTFLLFFFLQVMALWMLFRYNRYHRTAFLGVSNELTGSINRQVDKLDDYFHQGEENKRVHRMNDSLMNLLRQNFVFSDTSERTVVDSVQLDTTRGIRRYLWRDAKVVYNTVNFERNYMQLNRGSRGGIRPDMAVLNSDGAVVGMVVNVSPNFSQVMSLLHIQSSVSAALKKTGESGKVEWDAKDPRYVLLKGIPRNVAVKAGDTVLTSRYTYNFPPGYMIGTVSEVTNDVSTGFYLLKVRTAVNFNNVQQVFVVENLQREEQLALESETEMKIEQQQKRTNR